MYAETRAKCGRLCHLPEKRAAWGCDAPAPSAIFRGTCPRCLGGDPSCPDCEGFGERMFKRCPNGVQDEGSRRMLSAYGWLQRGVLPTQGALEDQTAAFVEAVRLIETERGLIHQSEMEG